MTDINVTPGTGKTVRTVTKGGKEAQVVILDLGGAGAESLLTTSLPVVADLGATDNAVLDSIDASTSRILTSATRIVPGAAMATTSIVAGGRYDATQKTLADGQEGSFAMSERGAMIVAPGAEGFLVTAKPLSAILEGGLTTLITKDEQVDTGEYSRSSGVALGGTYSGEILNVALYSGEEGSGAVQTPDGILYVLSANPALPVGEAALGTAVWPTIMAKIVVVTADWDADANGAFLYKSGLSIPFHAMANLYFVWKQVEAASFNDAAGDDETLKMNFWYRRES